MRFTVARVKNILVATFCRVRSGRVWGPFCVANEACARRFSSTIVTAPRLMECTEREYRRSHHKLSMPCWIVLCTVATQAQSPRTVDGDPSTSKSASDCTTRRPNVSRFSPSAKAVRLLTCRLRRDQRTDRSFGDNVAFNARLQRLTAHAFREAPPLPRRRGRRQGDKKSATPGDVLTTAAAEVAWRAQANGVSCGAFESVGNKYAVAFCRNARNAQTDIVHWRRGKPNDVESRKI
jgi:hypothetical protein